MRIVLDYRPALRERSGVGEYCHQLARALADSTSASDNNGRPELTLFSSSWKDRLDAGSVHPRAAGIDRSIPVSLLNFLWHRAEWPSVEVLAGRRFDVAHSPHPLLMPSRWAAQLITIHDLDFLEHPERTHAEVRRDYPVLVRTHARRADGILVPSRYTASRVQKLLGVEADRITVCPHGAPPWQPRTAGPPDGYVLFVGTLEPRKNIPGLLRAYRRLLEIFDNPPSLWLAGATTAASAPWLEEIARPPLAGHVRHVGYVNPDDRPGLYAGAALLVLPSFNEGFGLPVLEAMTMGVPVVAAERGAIPEVAGDAAVLCDPDDSEALATAMRDLLKDPQRMGELSRKGRQRASEFTWAGAAALVLKAYRDAVRRRDAGRGR